VALQDKTLNCRDCGSEFVFTASEQEFYQSKGFQNEPSRCPKCRAAKKAQMRAGGNGHHGGGGGFGGGQRQMFEITCSECGKTDTVPFQPKGDRPVLCRDCFQKRRQ
jgi:CxxC-x17-CxxC domain-containing protein